jgi:hypothetical protein
VIRVHVDRLDLGTEAAASLKVTEDDQLADTHDLTVELGDMNPPAGVTALGQSLLVAAAIRRILDPTRRARHRTEGEQLDHPGKVVLGAGSKYEPLRPGSMLERRA